MWLVAAKGSTDLVPITLLASVALVLAAAILPAISTITTLLPAISTITTLLPTISAVSALVTATLVLLVVVVARIVLGLTLDLLAVVEVFALGLDEAVRFDTGETGEDLFG